MAHTPARPVDIAGVFPELAGQERATVRLHPRRGRPGPRDTSIGGPVLWPAAEPWPRCDAGDRHIIKVYDPDAEIPGRRRRGAWRLTTDPRHIAAPMVSVAQLFARDVPGLPCPVGTDICQVLWCPADHEPDFGPRVRVRWRDSHEADLDGPLGEAPPSDPDMAKEDYIPQACSLSPEQVVDHPDWWELPDDLRQRIRAWEQDGDWIYKYHLGAAPGCKVGAGRPGVRIRSGRLVLRATRWTTYLPDKHDDTGLMLGDVGDVYIFTCVTCDEQLTFTGHDLYRPIASVFQCS
jgi:hypothetical protein